MEKKKVAIINYTDGHTLDEEGIATPTRKEKVVIMNSVKRYYNCIYLLAGLKPSARNLMDFIVEEMDEENLIHNNAYTRLKFISFMKEITFDGEEATEYKEPTVREGFQRLSKAGLIKPLMKGLYKVNPLYFFKGDDEKRIAEIVLELKMDDKLTRFTVTKNYK